MAYKVFRSFISVNFNIPGPCSRSWDEVRGPVFQGGSKYKAVVESGQVGVLRNLLKENGTKESLFRQTRVIKENYKEKHR